MDKKIITISREFGSGGRTIGKLIAETLGVPYYDKELVKRVATETGFDESFVEATGEDAPVKSRLAYVFSAIGGTQGVMNGLSADDFLWAIQHKVILELAEKEACVIVGRCADFILSERNDCFNVFIHADVAARASRIVNLYGETEKLPEKRLEEKDKRRSLYYNRHTGQKWGMSQNYHLSLDSGKIGIEKCAELIISLTK